VGATFERLVMRRPAPARLSPPAGVGRRRNRAVLALAAVAAVGAAAFWAYGGGFPNTDASWTLVWGRELLHLHAPSFAGGATPHPLSNLLGVVAAALDPASETVLQVVGYAAVGALVVGAFAIARSLFGVAAGLLAAALLATRDTLLFYGALAYVDVIFAALVVWAIALEAARPRRGVPVLVLLALAGLARPEAWLLSGAYWLYARPADRRDALRWVVLVVAPPLLWAAVDLVLTGDPLFSFTATTDATVSSGRPTGLEGLLAEGPRIAARTARPDVCLAALAGLVVAWRADHVKLLAGAMAGTAVAVAIPVAAGTPLNDRYLITTMALLCVAAAAPLALVARGERPAWRLAGAGCLLVLAIGAVDQVPRFVDRRDSVLDRDARRDAAHAALRPGIPCRPLVLPNNRFVPVAASWLDLQLSDVRDGRRGVPPGSYLWGTADAMRNLLVIEGRAGGVAPPPSAPVVRRAGAWTLMARCQS
jgi:hypothetical protein